MNGKEDGASSNGEGAPQKPLEIVSRDGQVTLRQLTLADAGELFALIDRNRDHLSQFGDDTAGKYKSLSSVVESITHPRNPNRLRFGIRNKAGELVGSINLTPQENNPERAEVGYYLGREYQGQGYQGRALEAVTDYGFGELGYKEIFGEVVIGNDKSVHVLERAGYRETQRKADKIILTKTSPGHS